MANDFSSGIFTPQPTSSGLLDGNNFGSDGLSFAANAIGKAMGQRTGNPWEETFGAPLRKRKRRQIAQQLSEEGLSPKDGTKYWTKFEDKLIEAGDMEGAEKVGLRRQQSENQQLERDKLEADIGKTKAETAKTEVVTELLGPEFDLQHMKTSADIDNALAELDLKRDQLSQKTGNDADLNQIRRAELSIRRRGLDLEERSIGIKQDELSLKASAAPSEVAANVALAKQRDSDAELQAAKAARLAAGLPETIGTEKTPGAPSKVTTTDVKKEVKLLDPMTSADPLLKEMTTSQKFVFATRVRELIETAKQVNKAAGRPSNEAALRAIAYAQVRSESTEKPGIFNDTVNVPSATSGLFDAADQIIGN